MIILTPGVLPPETRLATGTCTWCHAVICATTAECELLNLLVRAPIRSYPCPTCGNKIVMVLDDADNYKEKP